MPGMGELLIILVIVLLIFGAGKLPGIGDALGRSIRNFKRASKGEDEIEVKKAPAIDTSAARELKDGGADGDEVEEVVVRRKVRRDS
jgi:sec-independent protein translocase protein TatA